MSSTILVIDDDPAILEVVKIILEDKGFFVVTNSNGLNIEETLHSCKPSLILMDIWMAHKSGEEIARQLKSQNHTHNIPIIMVSANNDTEIIAKKAGADDFLSKPFDISDLLGKIEKYIPMTT